MEWAKDDFTLFCVLTFSCRLYYKMTSCQTTLSDVNTKPCTGPIPDVLPKANSSQTGVSLKYGHSATARSFVFDEHKKWYVLRASYNREEQAKRYFKRHKIACYLPVRSEYRTDENGRKCKETKPFLRCLIFVYDTEENIRRYVKSTPSLHYLQYYYNRFQKTSSGADVPVTLDYEDMMNFIDVTSVRNPHTMMVDKAKCRYKSNDIVRVTRGDFAGVCGRVVRVAGEQRVVVEVKNFGFVATAYIPSAFLEYI